MADLSMTLQCVNPTTLEVIQGTEPLTLEVAQLFKGATGPAGAAGAAGATGPTGPSGGPTVTHPDYWTEASSDWITIKSPRIKLQSGAAPNNDIGYLRAFLDWKGKAGTTCQVVVKEFDLIIT